MPTVHGRLVDDQTRCAHWHGATDVIAIKFACCGRYFACYECHQELEDHALRTWSATDVSQPAVLCGVCRRELGISEYLSSGFVCPGCGAAFNPGCANHYHFYFSPELLEAAKRGT